MWCQGLLVAYELMMMPLFSLSLSVSFPSIYIWVGSWFFFFKAWLYLAGLFQSIFYLLRYFSLPRDYD